MCCRFALIKIRCIQIVIIFSFRLYKGSLFITSLTFNRGIFILQMTNVNCFDMERV